MMQILKRAAILLALAGALLAVDTRCPIDDTAIMWTGKTKVDSGKLLKEFKCLKGHIFWMVN